MKKIFTLLCGIAFAAQFTTVSAQSTTKMKVYTTDGNVVEYSTSEVDSVTFSAQEDTYAYKIINGHKFINLGLSVLWAETNVGAEAATGFGNYYAWGETKPKTNYTEESYTKPETLDATHDAATANWETPCRMPTKDEFDELMNKCDWTWDDTNKGYKITSKTNDNSIFLPASGYHTDEGLQAQGTIGEYWSSSDNGSTAVISYFSKNYKYIWSPSSQYYGCTIRPVATLN